MREILSDDKKITVITMPNKASLLDFTKEQTAINYESGYINSIKKLEKALI